LGWLVRPVLLGYASFLLPGHCRFSSVHFFAAMPAPPLGTAPLLSHQVQFWFQQKNEKIASSILSYNC
jgi:hypothetical protein